MLEPKNGTGPKDKIVLLERVFSKVEQSTKIVLLETPQKKVVLLGDTPEKIIVLFELFLAK